MTDRITTHSARDVTVIVMARGREKYILVYSEANRGEAVRQLGRWASNYDLSFTWYDAARLSHEMRNEKQSTRGAE